MTCNHFSFSSHIATTDVTPISNKARDHYCLLEDWKNEPSSKKQVKYNFFTFNMQEVSILLTVYKLINYTASIDNTKIIKQYAQMKELN